MTVLVALIPVSLRGRKYSIGDPVELSDDEIIKLTQSIGTFLNPVQSWKEKGYAAFVATGGLIDPETSKNFYKRTKEEFRHVFLSAPHCRFIGRKRLCNERTTCPCLEDRTYFNKGK